MTYRIILLGLLLAGTTLANQPDRRASFKAAIKADQAALAAVQATSKKEIAELEKKLQQKASELLDLQLELESLREGNRRMRKTANDLAASESQVSKTREQVVTTTASTISQLDILFSELPDRAKERKQLADAADPLTGKASPRSVNVLLTTLDQLHADATTTTVRTAQLHQPNGDPIEAQLLSISNAHFAYTLPDRSAAIALKSPADASGFRWKNELPPEMTAAVLAAVSEINNTGTASIPIDVTGTLRLQSWQKEDSLTQQLSSGGPLMIPLAVIAILAGLLMLERLYVWFNQRGNPAAITDALHACEEQKYTEANEILARSKPGVAARLIQAALERQEDGQEAMEDSIEVRLLKEVPRLRHRLNGIAVLGGVAPLLGLLGTVTGIIETFAVIRSSGTTDVALMAGGISQALVTTAAGLVVAIPILLLHRILAGAMDRIISDAESQAATALTILSKGKSS